MNDQQDGQLLTIFDGISKTLESILVELKRHNDNAKDRSDGIEEAVREVGQAVADGLKALDLLVPTPKETPPTDDYDYTADDMAYDAAREKGRL